MLDSPSSRTTKLFLKLEMITMQGFIMQHACHVSLVSKIFSTSSKQRIEAGRVDSKCSKPFQPKTKHTLRIPQGSFSQYILSKLAKYVLDPFYNFPLPLDIYEEIYYLCAPALLLYIEDVIHSVFCQVFIITQNNSESIFLTLDIVWNCLRFNYWGYFLKHCVILEK